MSKMIKDQLFELIKSLTKSEKRYFKLYVSRHSSAQNTNYSTLFDYFEHSERYDEKNIFKHFKDEPFLNNFSITKKRLYDQIISSLNSFHSGNSIDAQLYKALQGADILYKKALYSQAEKLLYSAHKVATKYERMVTLLEIEHRQQQLIEARHYSSVKKDELTEKQKRSDEIIHQLKIQTALWFTKSHLFIELNKKGLLRDQHHKSQLIAYHNHINEIIDQTQLSTSNTYLYHHIEAAYYFAIDDYHNCLIHLSKNLELLEKTSFLMDEFPNYYFGTLTNAVYVSEQLGDSVNADKLLEKLKTFPTTFNLELSEDLLLKIFLSTSSIELSILISRGEFLQALKIIPIIENGLQLYGDKIPIQKKLFFAYKFAGVQIGLNDFSGALKWINHILNTPNMDNNEDIIAFTHILNLLLHLELKNDQLLPYTIKSTQRYLKTRNRLYPFEQMILRFTAGFNRSKKDFAEKEAWQKLHQELIALQNTPDQQIISEYFDFETWVESKITNKPFHELIQAKKGNK